MEFSAQTNLSCGKETKWGRSSSRVPIVRSLWWQWVLHLPCGFVGDLLARQLTDNMQAHVDAGGNARRTDHPTVVHETAIRMDDRLWSGLPKQINGAVVSGRLQAIEQPGLRQEQRPGANGKNEFQVG